MIFHSVLIRSPRAAHTVTSTQETVMTSAVFTPQKLGNVVSKNRIFCPAHQMFLCLDGRVGDRLIEYLEARAAGGVGLLIIESAPVHTSSSGSPKQLVIWDDESIEGIARVRERLAPYD